MGISLGNYNYIVFNTADEPKFNNRFHILMSLKPVHIYRTQLNFCHMLMSKGIIHVRNVSRHIPRNLLYISVVLTGELKFFSILLRVSTKE